MSDAVKTSDKVLIRKRSKGMKYFLKNKYFYIMLLPMVIWYIIFRYAPMYGVILSFQKFSFLKGIFGSPFIGFDNFKVLFSDTRFMDAMKNTFIINSLRIVCGFPMPIIFALMLNEVSHLWFKRIVQTITYLPHFVSWIIFAGILNLLLAQDSGILNAIMGKFGVKSIAFLTSSKHFRGVLILSEIWKEMGWNTIIYLAGIAAINPQLYEAAEIDGASRLQKAMHITIPSIKSTIAIMFILNIGNIVQIGFDQIYNLYNPAVYDVADILDTYIVRNLQRNPRFGVLSSASTVKAVISLLFLLSANRLVKLFGEEGIY